MGRIGNSANSYGSRRDELANEQDAIVILLVNNEQERTIANELKRRLSIRCAAESRKERSGSGRLTAVLVNVNASLMQHF